jgi:hypothetical protein
VSELIKLKERVLFRGKKGAYELINSMETDEASHDHFSSFTIHEFNSQTENENIVTDNDVHPHQKLKPRRKLKKAT